VHVMVLVEEVGAIWGAASLFGCCLWIALVRAVRGKA